jgi:GH15 family glucan-1,4-alpha-glucosidase
MGFLGWVERLGLDRRLPSVLYRIDGTPAGDEEDLEHLDGYGGARPVRLGNRAAHQVQLDIYGEVIAAVWICSELVKEMRPLSPALWRAVRALADEAAARWEEPDRSLWEERPRPRHYLSSKVMCWVAMDRAARLAELRGETGTAQRWQGVADEIHAEVLERGVRSDGVFRQHYDTDALDASTLLIPLVRFLPASDERVRATADAIDSDLTERGLVLRYRTQDTDDGLHGEEGTFLICSFWLVSVLSEIGERDRAQELCERVLAYAGPLELFAEELDARSGRQLGNYPQAFTHLALINAVSHVIADAMR